MAAQDVDIIGGFQKAEPNCAGCGKPLLMENAWMTDGCPCNTTLGVNSMNETRWRLLMQLQQEQSRKLAAVERQRDGLSGLMEAARDVLELKSKCRYDHNDLCQEHYSSRPCNIERLRTALAACEPPTPGEKM